MRTLPEVWNSAPRELIVDTMSALISNVRISLNSDVHF